MAWAEDIALENPNAANGASKTSKMAAGDERLDTLEIGGMKYAVQPLGSVIYGFHTFQVGEYVKVMDRDRIVPQSVGGFIRRFLTRGSFSYALLLLSSGEYKPFLLSGLYKEDEATPLYCSDGILAQVEKDVTHQIFKPGCTRRMRSETPATPQEAEQSSNDHIDIQAKAKPYTLNYKL